MRLTALLFVLAACSSGKPQPAAVTPAPTTPTQTAEPMTPEQCTTQGGEVRGDIGDGKIACADGEKELGRVTTGIEGGVCCQK
ncbi:MAG: hypothetical protein WKG01_09870 [Kofleriaceae bacterium]